MKKKILLLMMGVFSLGLLKAQVGINTDNPLTDLHLVGDQYTTGKLKVGGNTTFTTSAQLELGDINKGFLPNRVALTDLEVKAPVVNAVTGILVYNTTDDGAIKPGYYFWNGSSWEAFLMSIPDNLVNGFDLLTGATSIATSPANSEDGTYLNIGDKTLAGKTYFTVGQSGSYAFAIRVYGAAVPQPGKTAGRACVYFTLMINGVKVDVQEVNWALVDPAIAGAQNRLGGTVILTANNIKSTDRVQFVLAHYNVVWSQPVSLTQGSGLTANRTSIVFWRL